jgi:tetratricopeptide (TPR) repeat protein
MTLAMDEAQGEGVVGLREAGASGHRLLWRAALTLAALVLASLITWPLWGTYRADQLWRLAEASARASRWDRAEEALARRAWYGFEEPKALRLRASVALARGDTLAAAALLGRIPAEAPDAEWAWMNRGRLLMEQFRLREAESAFAACVRRNPTLFEARRQLVIIHGLRRRGPEQDAQLWEILDRGIDPLFALSLLAPGRPGLPAGVVRRSVDEGQILGSCLAVDPDDPHVRPALAYFLRNRGRVAEARRLLEPWLRAHPDDADATHEWLACLLDAGDDDAARRSFGSPTEADRGSARYRMLRAEWLGRQGRDADAIHDLGEAVQHSPRDPEPRYRLGQALRTAGRAEKAAVHLNWAERAYELRALVGQIPDQSPDPALLARAGGLCRKMGREREARGWYTAALRIDPDNAEARAALGPRAERRGVGASQ